MKEIRFDSGLSDSFLDEVLGARIARFESVGVQVLAREARNALLKGHVVGICSEKNHEVLHTRLIALCVLCVEWLEAISESREAS